jgi:cyclic beta-1,2-glucan synthetase
MADAASPVAEPETAPAAAPLFSHEQLESHALALAAAHTLSADPRRARPLLPRLDESASRLEAAYQFLSTIARTDPQPVASEDWLRDNYHVVQDQVREVRQDLPRKFYLELPKLSSGAHDGYPRVYLIARELIAHTAGRFDLDTLVDFVDAYQRTAPLSIGETWAIPIMLRLGLVEELRRLVDGVVSARRSREQARKWEIALRDRRPDSGRELDRLLQAEVEATGHLSAAFVVELLQWLRDQPPSAAPAWHALQRALEAQGDSPEELLRLEHHREATDQLAIGNVITSMRLLSSIDWPIFFDRVSVVEAELKRDPVGAYAEMDFRTRDRYRHSVEELSRGSKTPELQVAERAIAMAREAQDRDPANDRAHHVGYYLISRGRFLLERQLGYPPRARERLARFFFAYPALGYPGTVALMVALGTGGLLAYGERHGASAGMLWLIAVLSFIPVSELALALLNALLTSAIRPRLLPKLALKHGIPVQDRTMVAVPAIIDSEARIQQLFHDLEVRFLANRDPHLHFALLSDFADAASETTTDDQGLLASAQERVDDLNARHGANRFFLFHRQRRWNAAENRWMGWERKRGKLAEFNRVLRGATDTSFVVASGDQSIVRSVRYVITLDSDTHLPMEAACRLVGTLSHPLNRPRFDARLQRVTEGYGVLQPRVQVSIESAARSMFAQVFAGHVGVDPYTTAVSDVYQDLFHEGSYVGKGIYDVDAFEAALAGRVPQNALLSHDLFEGLYARAGLCTDIELVDDYPSNYLAFAARQHRWVRGDWQIARWLWRTVPDEHGHVVANGLPAISRWKILDNLRRSVLAPALVALFIAGWTVLPGSSMVWSLLGVLVLAFPAYMQVGRSLTSRMRGVPLREHVLAERDNLAVSATQAFLSTVFLLHQCWVMIDAIGRTMVRLLITRRRLLEWVTADHRAHVEATPGSVFRRMIGVPVAGGVIAVIVAVTAPARLALALPVIALWCLSPMLAYATGRELFDRQPVLNRAERAAFRRIARKTWRFFDDLIVAGDHWLIPDNIQENRREFVAHRTSPTNIGLQLLSTLAAYDLGYITSSSLVTRLEATFGTLLSMQRYRGHFYNWYDTQTLEPLLPRYISTVDSGNLAGYLVTVRSALLQFDERTPAVNGSFLEGLDDIAGLVEQDLARGGAEAATAVNTGRVKKELARLRAELASRPHTDDQWRALLLRIRDHISIVGVLLHEIEEPFSAVEGGGTVEAARHGDADYWLDRAATAVAECLQDLEKPMPAAELIERAERLASLADDLVEETEFGFLFDEERQLFAIGFNVSDGRLDVSYYDTLASEARLASFLAIATGKIAPDHWFRLGRSLTPSGGSRALLSWSASMFEYLMPLLVMRTYPGTLLHETYGAVVQRQIQYGQRRGVPWGISESAYYAQDLDGNYQYRAFGVPGLGLKRGLGDDLVVAPYATFLASTIDPRAVHDNAERLRAEGLEGRFGFYEAIDYTADRFPPEHAGGGIALPTYMAHHQGMTLVSIDNALNGSPMPNRFHADLRVQSAELLLQERIPHLVPLKNPPIEKAEHVPSTRRMPAVQVRRYVTPHTLSPRTNFLSNGSYAVMLTNAGGGYSRRQGLAMTRWREDITTDAWGTFIYVRDLDSGEVWSTTYRPTGGEPDEYEVTFAPDRATFRRIDGDIELRTEIVVSPEDDAEIRRVSITNHGRAARRLELTSYAEVVLAPGDADLSHPAFSNLFVETIAVPERDALICVRRPRSGAERLHLVHVLSGRGRLGDATEYETDRARFLGRGRAPDRPRALSTSEPLSNTVGPVLDPIVSLRQSVRVPPAGTARLAFTTGFADNEAGARQLIEKYHDRRAVARALALASTHSQIELRHLGLSPEETMRFQRLSGRLMYGDPRLRAIDAVRVNRRGQPDLWRYGISGDMPILLVQIKDAAEAGLLRELLKAHEYLRRKGLAFDLVVLNELGSSYLQDLQNTLLQMVETSPEQGWIDRPGGVFLRRSDLMPAEDRTLLEAAARVVMDGAGGNLREQLKRPQIPFGPEPGQIAQVEATAGRPPSRDRFGAPGQGPRRIEQEDGGGTNSGDGGTNAGDMRRGPLPPAEPALELFNGIGGFADQGREYAITVDTDEGIVPPQPWSNVVAHPTFGFAATESSPGYTWSLNSHDNRITPWRNDPVSDPPGEAVFVRDEQSGQFWSATPLPSGAGAPYSVRHGQGYSSYEHVRGGIVTSLRLFVPPSDHAKVFYLTLRNDSAARRRLTVTLYVDWVLGENRSRTHLHTVTSAENGTLFARNAFRQEFSGRIAFLDLEPAADLRGPGLGRAGKTEKTITGDRMEFIGRNGSLERPAAMRRVALSNRTGPALDPCGAIQVTVDLEPSETRTLIGLLGDAVDVAAARELVAKYRDRAAVDAALQQVVSFWDRILGTIVVRTPDRALDLMLNRWLPYQSLACRVWGRSAFYQSSGAFGFRDQLQDVMALLFSAPRLARHHLLHAASRQFVEGDVQHWWHEPGGQGVRTRFSDDRLWLVYAALQYVSATADDGVLDEEVSFLEGRLLGPDEHDAYERPTISTQKASLYEHCVRAMALNLDTGPHGLPLIGVGDWNDGMNMVGPQGRGESVWLAWFILSLLPPLAALAQRRGDTAHAGQYLAHAETLRKSVEDAWDGEWYRRAYFDDGTPLGSRQNAECRIDAIAQSWAVISDAADPARARQAMESADAHLVRRDAGLALLLTPPFESMVPSPGYIQGYVPGVRENGGQYTHAALWTVMAFARLGDGDRAMEIFDLLNPPNKTRTVDDVARYRAEPYVVAADVYSNPAHVGRGGWTWYTGSASWMYRVGIEELLGFTLRRGALHIDPCIPRHWPRYDVTVKTPEAEFNVVVENPDRVSRGVRRIELDGVAVEGDVPMAGAAGAHAVRVILG